VTIRKVCGQRQRWCWPHTLRISLWLMLSV